MRTRRGGVANHVLAAGPGGLTQALGINRTIHGSYFLDDPDRRLQRGQLIETCAGVRIGISKAREFPWRFGDPKSVSLSQKFLQIWRAVRLIEIFNRPPISDLMPNRKPCRLMIKSLFLKHSLANPWHET